MAAEEKNLFVYLNNIYTKQFIFSDEDVKSVTWAVNRFLSMEKDLLEHIAYLSRYMFTLGPKYYKLLMRVVPQSFVQRNKYIKTERKTDDDLLERYVRYFKLSKKEVRDYLKILSTKYTKEEIYDFAGLEVS